MKKLYFLLSILIVCAFLAGFFWNKQSSGLKEIEFVTENISYGSDDGDYKITAHYPVLNEGLSKKATEKINKEIKDFLENSVNEAKDEFAELSKELIEVGSSAKPQYVSNFLIKNDFDKLPFINIVFETYYYTGGAHGITNVETFVFNANTGDRMALQDFFIGEYLKKISNLSLEILNTKDPKGEIYTFASEGVAPEIENFSSFTMEGDGMHIIFGDYQVGPYAIGHPEIVIPYEPLNDVLRSKIISN